MRMTRTTLAILLLSFFWSSTLALKGGQPRARASLRRLQEPPVGTDAEKKAKVPKEIPLVEASTSDLDSSPMEKTKAKSKTKTKTKTKSKEKGKTKEKKKKCKKTKKAKKSKSKTTEEEDSIDENLPPPASAPLMTPGGEEEEEEPYCLHGALSAEECKALEMGEVLSKEKSVKGMLSLEIVHNENGDLVDEVQNILQTEVAPRYAGCPASKTDESTRRFLQEVDPNFEIDEEDGVAVTGIGFESVAVSDQGCNAATEGSSCDKIESLVEIYYEGSDAEEAEQDEMFAMLSEIIQTQAAQGAFASVGSVSAVESALSVDSGTSGNTESSPSRSKSPAASAGIPSGVVAGILFIAVMVVGYKYNKRQNAGAARGGPVASAKNDETDDSSSDEEGNRAGDPPVQEAQAILLEDDDYMQKKKKGKAYE